MNKNEMGLWIVDELVFDPHLPDRVVARDGDRWYTIDPKLNTAPKEYRAVVGESYMRLTYNHDYLACGCVPRSGFVVTAKRGATEAEFDIIKKKYDLGADDISDQFVVKHGAIYGEKAAIEFKVRQIRVKSGSALPAESEIMAMGIQANSGSGGRVDVRIA